MIKMLCWIAANGNSNIYFELYERRTLLDVYEIIMLKKALDYDLYH